ncbi:MAG: BTAD domain-containing putative transcriptional regulator, partial [Planctomycetota bacterium]
MKVLGGFEARLASGDCAEIPIRKGQALLAYLALHPDKTLQRTKLAGLLWGDHTESQAQTNLRQTLTVLRKALAAIQEDVLRADRKSIGLNWDCLEVDAASFEELVARGAQSDLEAAVALYRGDLLDGIEVPDPGFQAWLEDERRRYRDLMARALNALMELKHSEGAREEAIALGQRLLSLDPLQERVHRWVMTIYSESGQREAAIQQFQTCRDLLASELGVEPEPETEALYQTLCGNGETPGRGTATAKGAAPESVSDKPAATHPADGLASRLRSQPRSWKWPVAGGIALTAVAVALGLLWFKPWAPDVEPASLERMAFPLPDKPSIAVLPFDNLSKDPDQDYFADGITDDLITELSRLDELFVIARNSTSVYKGRAVGIRQVAEDLGVRYVLEGSVRRRDGQIRINVQLIDALTGSHIWAERYDNPLNDLFSVQDQVTERVAFAIAGALTSERLKSQVRRETDDPKAYDAFLRGSEQWRRYTRENYALAIRHLSEAVELDPGFARAHAMLGGAYWEIANDGWEESFGMTYDEAFDKAKHHLDLAMRNPTSLAHFYLSKSHSNEGRFEAAVVEAKKMIALNPNHVLGYKALGRALNKAGRSSESVAALQLAIRLDPRGDDQGWVSYRLGEALYLSGRDAEAAEAFARSAERNQNEWSYAFLAASLAQLGRQEAALEALERFNLIQSEAGEEQYTVAAVESWAYKLASDRARVQEGFRKAGMPEGATTSVSLDWAQDVSPLEVEGATTIDAAAAKALIERGVAVVDVRNGKYWNAGHIPGAAHLNLYKDFT